jgi:hypothetical protein
VLGERSCLIRPIYVDCKGIKEEEALQGPIREGGNARGWLTRMVIK